MVMNIEYIYSVADNLLTFIDTEPEDVHKWT